MDNNSNDEMLRRAARMQYGQYIMNIISLMENSATEKELIDHFVTLSGQPEQIIAPDIQEVLQIGVSAGYLERHENNYSVPGYQCNVNNQEPVAYSTFNRGLYLTDSHVQTKREDGTDKVNESHENVALGGTSAQKRKFGGGDEHGNTKNARFNEV